MTTEPPRPLPTPALRAVRALAGRAAVLVAVSAAVGFGANAVRPGGLRIATFSPPVACTGAEEHGAGGAPSAVPAYVERSIAPRKASSLCSRDDVVVLDTRSEKRYAEGHVAGAVHLPCDAAGVVVHTALAGFEKASMVIVYGEHDDDAQPVAASLRTRLPTTKRVLTLEGGFAAWEAASLSCVSGPCDECGGASASRPDPKVPATPAPPETP